MRREERDATRTDRDDAASRSRATVEVEAVGRRIAIRVDDAAARAAIVAAFAAMIAPDQRDIDAHADPGAGGVAGGAQPEDACARPVSAGGRPPVRPAAEPALLLRLAVSADGERYRATGVDDAGRLACGPDGFIAPLADIVWYLRYQLTRAFVAARPDLLWLHAAGVIRDGRALLLAGASGCGKSTLATALVRRGFGYLGDEVMAIDPATRCVWPVPMTAAVRAANQPLAAAALIAETAPMAAGAPGARTALAVAAASAGVTARSEAASVSAPASSAAAPSTAAVATWLAPHDVRRLPKVDVAIDGARVAREPTPVGALLLPVFSRDATGLLPLAPSHAALELMRHLVDIADIDRAMRTMATIASSAPAARLAFCDAEQAADAAARHFGAASALRT